MKCRVCDFDQFFLGIDLGKQPWGNHFLQKEEIGKEPFYPLKVVVCEKCMTAQLDYTVKKEVMFQNHTYLSGITKSLAKHFAEIAAEVDERFFSFASPKTALDIGSNDGTQLQAYKNLGYEVLGVESATNVAAIASKSGIPTINAFFNEETAEKIGKKFDLINASGVFFHLEELHSVCEAIKKHLKEKGVFVVQFLYMKSILQNIAFDQIYHEHLLYYTLQTIQVLLSLHGLKLFDAKLSTIHGGSIIGFVSHPDSYATTVRLEKLEQIEKNSNCNSMQAYQIFASKVKELKEKNLSFLQKMKEEGKRIFGMGAPVKGNTLLNYFGIGNQYLDCLVEKNELRKNLYSPGMHLPILLEKEMLPPDVYYVLAWNFKKEILENNHYLIRKGVKFYFPIEVKK